MRQQGGTKFAHLYRTARWQDTRARQLAREPLCWRCAKRGLTVAATVCNHSNGHPEGETEAAWWSGPFDSQCAACHSGDTAREEQGKGAKGCDTDGWPHARTQQDALGGAPSTGGPGTRATARSSHPATLTRGRGRSDLGG